MSCQQCCPDKAARRGLRRGLKFLAAGVTVGALGYALATVVLFLTELTRADDPKRALLTPLRHALLAAYFLCPGLSLYGIARAVYALASERGARHAGPTPESAEA